MKWRRTELAIVLMALIVTAGCMGKVRYPSYYTLHLSAVPDPPPPAASHSTLAVREFRSPAYLRQGAIVYRTSQEQIGFYNYHRWAVDPREFLTNAVAQRMRESSNFASVKLYDGRADSDYILSGNLQTLEEIDDSNGVRVEVTVSAQMSKVATGATVWSNQVTESGAVAQRSVPAVVAEMNAAMNRAIGKLLSPAPMAENPTAN